MSTLKELVEVLAKAVVDDTDAVIVRELAGDKAIVFELSVAPNEKGRVIGRRGAIVSAMRILLNAVAAKEGKFVELEIV